MKRDRRLGLDELMIVNPSSSRTEAMYLGEDGMLYEVQGLSEDGEFQGWGRLEEVGSLYQDQDIVEQDSTELGAELEKDFEGDDVRAVGQYFLGADGTLYGVVL